MSTTVNFPMPIAVQQDFIETFGWDRLVAELGGERTGMKDAWTAVEFAMPKGRQAVTCTVKVHRKLVPILKLMLEVRWADHFSSQGELEAPYDRIIARLTAIANRKGKR